jgi:site-specific DNA-methyltransferase (adenine-specific)
MDTDTILTGDCFDVMSTLPAGCADLGFIDQPFNRGLPYIGYKDRLPEEVYLARMDRLLSEMRRILAPTGSLFVQINDEWAGDVKVRLDAMFSRQNWRNTIIWAYRFGQHQKRKFGRDHQQILYYVADPKHFTFNADDVRIRSERQRLGDKRANPDGRVPGDVWLIRRLPGNDKRRRGHPCQTPPEVAERIIRAASNPGDVVLDLMCGTGSVLAVAKRLSRRWLGIEVSPATAEQARRHVANETVDLFARLPSNNGLSRK